MGKAERIFFIRAFKKEFVDKRMEIPKTIMQELPSRFIDGELFYRHMAKSAAEGSFSFALDVYEVAKAEEIDRIIKRPFSGPRIRECRIETDQPLLTNGEQGLVVRPFQFTGEK